MKSERLEGKLFLDKIVIPRATGNGGQSLKASLYYTAPSAERPSSMAVT